MVALKKSTKPTTKKADGGRAIAVKTFTNKKAVQASLKRKGGGGNIQRIPEEGVTVRFLTEADGWVEFTEVYDGTGYYPLYEGEDVPHDGRASTRYLANVLVRGPEDHPKKGQVVALKLPKKLAGRVFAKGDRVDTMTDRDYTLSKFGEGTDTEYDVDSEPVSKVNLAKYEDNLLDLAALLAAERANYDEAQDDDEDEKPKSKAAAKSTNKPKGKPAPADEDDDEEEEPEDEDTDDEEADDEEESEVDVEALMKAAKIADKKGATVCKPVEDVIAAGELDIDPQEYELWTEVVDAIVEALGGGDEDESDEEEADDDDAEAEDGDEEESEDDEEVEIDADTLGAMSLSELKKFVSANELDIETKGMTKQAIIDAIIELAE